MPGSLPRRANLRRSKSASAKMTVSAFSRYGHRPGNRPARDPSPRRPDLDGGGRERRRHFLLYTWSRLMKNKTILLVEDNPDDQELIQMALDESHIANELVIVSDGAQALDYLLGSGKSEVRDLVPLPQVILLDLKLPKVSGLEVLRRLRSEPRTALVPVVILTTSSEQEDMLSSYALHANSYTRKPVDFGQFAEAVKQLGLYWLVLNEAPPMK